MFHLLRMGIYIKLIVALLPEQHSRIIIEHFIGFISDPCEGRKSVFFLLDPNRKDGSFVYFDHTLTI